MISSPPINLIKIGQAITLVALDIFQVYAFGNTDPIAERTYAKLGKSYKAAVPLDTFQEGYELVARGIEKLIPGGRG